MIAVDWGSTNFRATLLDDGNGSVIDRISSDEGIKKHRGGQSFEDTLFRSCGDWITNQEVNDIFLSGMVGSREGWIEVPYVKTSCGAVDLAEALIEVPSKKLPESSRIWIVPGVCHSLGQSGDTDVMRGEETEVMGLLSNQGLQDAVICIPGTHSKWIACTGGEISTFKTWLTGEAFERLTKDSLISGDSDSKQSIATDDDAFIRGLSRSRQSGGLLHHLFLGRTDMLMKHVAPESLPSLISGLLIGHEIGDAIQFAGKSPVHLIGKTNAARAYAKAFEWFGIEFIPCETEVHPAGILKIASNR